MNQLQFSLQQNDCSRIYFAIYSLNLFLAKITLLFKPLFLTAIEGTECIYFIKYYISINIPNYNLFGDGQEKILSLK